MYLRDERSTHIFLWITALINKTNIVFVHNVMIIIIHTGPDGDDNPRVDQVDPFSTLRHSYVNIISNPHYGGDPGAGRGTAELVTNEDIVTCKISPN